MQDPTAAAFQAVVTAPPFPAEEQNLRCPRCDSTNTKFCYYNNYNLSQPRHFCKDCRRYWTKGGALRNIPVGGGTRKNSKRGASSSSSTSNTKRSNNPPSAPAAVAHAGVAAAGPSVSAFPIPKIEPISALYPAADADHQMLDFTGSFSSLLTSSGHFGSLLESIHAGVPSLLSLPGASDPSCLIGSSSLELHSPSNGAERGENGPPPPPTQPQQSPVPDNLLGDSGCWNGGSGWPDLSIHPRFDLPVKGKK